MKNAPSRYHGHRFPPEIIGYAVWVYHRFCLTFRDVEDLLAERGIIVSYEIRCPGKRPPPVMKIWSGRAGQRRSMLHEAGEGG
jgi:transposase-like protein